jgi:hypothetical protein
MSEIRYVPPAATSGPTGSGAAGQVTFWSAATVLTGSNNLFWDNTNGRLGIGTATPGVKLDIHGTGIIQQLNGLTTNNSYLDFQNAGSTKFRIGNTYNAGQNRLSIFNAAGTTEIFTALQNGFIGIGTNTPAYALDVNGTTRLQNTLTALNTIIWGSTGVGRLTFSGSDAYMDAALSGGSLIFRTNGSTTAMQIFSTQNVGIGTTTDIGAKLGIQASGSTSATKSIQVNNSGGTRLLQLNDDGGLYIGVYMYGNAFIFDTVNGQMTIGSSSSPAASSVIDMRSTTKGFLPPRMTNAQRTAIGSPAIGLIVYCTDAVEGLYIYKSTGWIFII